MMEPGLYVLVPIGVAAAEPPAAPVPLVDSVLFASFEDVWKEEVRRHLVGFQKLGVFSDRDLEEFEKARYCLLHRFAGAGGGQPIHPVIYNADELQMRRRIQASYPLASSWLRSFATLLLAGKVHFGCFDWWFGLQIPDPDSKRGANCYESRRVGWYGRWPADEKSEPADAEFWARVDSIRTNQSRCQRSSGLTLAVDMFARAVFAEDSRSELLGLWIALESLFSLGQDAGELSHQICERAAVFLEPPGAARVETYRALRRTYIVRSRLVHGSLHLDRQVDRERVSEAIGVAEETARRSLLAILTSEEQATRFASQASGLREYLEERLLNPECP